MLTQKDNVEEEFPVSFMSTWLQGDNNDYASTNKQAFVVFKAIKHFWPYILKSHTKVIAPHPSKRSLLVQKEPGDRRGNWLTSLQEYDLEINPSKLVKGQGLCKLATKEQDPHDDE